MPGKRAKRKGKNFENKIYRQIRDMKIPVRRPVGSGSGDEPGDVIIEVEPPYYLELKRIKEMSIWGGMSVFEKHSKLIKEEAPRGIPVLVYRVNYQDALVITEGQSDLPGYLVCPFDRWLKAIKENR